MKAGWGDWAGPGATEVSAKIQAKRDRLLVQVQREHDTQILKRADALKTGVMVSERRLKQLAKYKVDSVPYPFGSLEEYQRSLQLPLGPEWNASHIVSKMTQPEIKKRAGRIVTPIVLPKKSESAQVTADKKQRKPRHKKAKLA